MSTGGRSFRHGPDLLFALALLASLAASGLALDRAGILAAPPGAAAAGTGEAPPAVLVIDPGHGGLDGGATAADGARESLINLQIGLRVRDLAELLGMECIMTRTEEELEYPEGLASVREKKVWDQKRRLDLIQSTPGGILLSIHQNRYPDPRPSGSQVFYANTEGSRELAERIHDNLISALCPENRRVAAPASDSIYLMKQVRRTAVLVECGFLSNPEEALRLQGERTQTALALVLAGSCLQYLTEETAEAETEVWGME